ncbi:hypothetical protein ACLB2K_074546 [Fragaria x ananassa]
METPKFSLVVIVAMVLVFTFFPPKTFAVNYEVASNAAEKPESDIEVASAAAELDHEDYYDNIMVKNGSIVSTGLIRRKVDGCTTSLQLYSTWSCSSRSKATATIPSTIILPFTSAAAELDHEDYYDNIMVKNGSIVSTGLIRRKVDGCTTPVCNTMIIPCKMGCICVPLGMLPIGLCIGLCHSCNFTPPGPAPAGPKPRPPFPPQSFSPLPSPSDQHH